MRSAFFISDVHLTSMASPTGEALLSLVKKAQEEAEVFVVLGDLFDLWVGEGAAFQKEYAPLISEFQKLQKTCRLIYFEGNHDFHLEKFWKEKIGFELYHQPQMINFHNIKIWAEHGDEINREDHGYLFLRWFLRTPVLKYLSHKVPSTLVYQIGKRASKASRQYTDRKENKAKELFREYAQTLRNQKDFDYLVVGHTHLFDDFSFESPKGKGRLINLGSWFDSPHFLRIDAEGVAEHVKII